MTSYVKGGIQTRMCEDRVLGQIFGLNMGRMGSEEGFTMRT